MIRPVVRILSIFLAFAILFILQKPLFILVESAFSLTDIAHLPAIISHGLAMDLSVAGYLTVIPALLIIAGIWYNQRHISVALKVYWIIASIVVAWISVADFALYPYWGFRIDTTPLFYFSTSPRSAMASLSLWGWIAATLITAAYALIIYLWISWVANHRRLCGEVTRKIPATVAAVLFTALLIIPIRGGLTVATMNPGRSFFSTDMRLNHAALNPVFTLLYSATTDSDYQRFQFFDPEKLTGLLSRINNGIETADSVPTLSSRPDIYLIILESFSDNLIPSLGGDSIAINLDRISRESISFTDLYASSFRTDRALPAILCGFPAQPTTSIMKYVERINALPSLSKTLKDSLDYELTYYYGGDTNFTNMNALLRSCGFESIVRDTDFPISQRLSKWGVHDDVLFSRVKSDIDTRAVGQPQLRVIQTSSSHEPFEVPFSKAANKRVNAFMYADSCVGDFIDHIRASQHWDNSLILITADHYGCYPEKLRDYQRRHRIPLIITGGAADSIDRSAIDVEATASQTDIAATLLSLLGLPSDQFRYSRSLLRHNRQPYAFFSEPSWYALLRDGALTVVSTDTGETIFSSGSQSSDNADLAKAYLQSLYDFIYQPQ